MISRIEIMGYPQSPEELAKADQLLRGLREIPLNDDAVKLEQLARDWRHAPWICGLLQRALRFLHRLAGTERGNWISRLHFRTYTLQATGWVRSVSGLQSLISVYLLAMWDLTYFGRPFE